MIVRCEKVGPMQWRIYAPDREPFDYWSYALVARGAEHSDTFEIVLEPGEEIVL